MGEERSIPELKEILGAMIFGAGRPLRVPEMLRCLRQVAEREGGETRPYAEAGEREIRDTLAELKRTLAGARCGFELAEVAGGFRLQSHVKCGRWLKQLLDIGRRGRLSQPALETLSIVAYRQPLPRARIEAVRGVSVDHILRLLMELQLVKIVGRSDLPGRPFLYGTTDLFLEHFGLKTLADLKEVDPALFEAGGESPGAPPVRGVAEGLAGPGPADGTEQGDGENEGRPSERSEP